MRLLVLSWGTLVCNNPYTIASLYFLTLTLVALIIGIQTKLLAFVIFLVYIGGVMVLLSYCVILLPQSKVKFPPLLLLTSVLFLPLTLELHRSYGLGILYRSRAIFMVSLLLFYVLLSVIEIVNYSCGIMYVKFYIIFANRIDIDDYIIRMYNYKI